MRKGLRIETVRGRLTAFYVTILAITILIVGGLIYVLLMRALYTRIDDALYILIQTATTSLSNDLDEGQDVQDAARATAAELSSRQQMLAIYDDKGTLLAEQGRADDLAIVLPPLDAIRADEPIFQTIRAEGETAGRHRLAFRGVTIRQHDIRYIVVAGSPLESIDGLLLFLDEVLATVIPTTLLLAGIGGWLVARRSLSPLADMVDRARAMGADDLSARLPVGNPRDELGRLAETFNDLLARLDESLTQQRQFMADASHELRTPVATSRTAAHVALQKTHRDEQEYRETLAIVEQEATRLSRIVEDMFTLARADAGGHPVLRTPMYLDEVVEDVIRSARVIASTRNVAIEAATSSSAAFTGDEDLIRRLVANLLDNAVRHAPSGSAVRVALESTTAGYDISVTDQGPGVPVEIREHIFRRFYRGDAARTRTDWTGGGAGLGLAVARWIANLHNGDVSLVASPEGGTTFRAHLSNH